MILTAEEIQSVLDLVPFEDFIGSPEIAKLKMEEYNNECRAAIAKAQLKKVVDDAFERGAIRRVKSKHNFPDHIEVDLIRLQEFLVALLEEVK